MQKNKFSFVILILLSISAVKSSGQQIPQTFKGKTHMMTIDELNQMQNLGKGFIETEPPVGYIRNIAEFEKMEGVLVTYLSNSGSSGYFGIPVDLIAEMAEDVTVFTVVKDTIAQNKVKEIYSQAGVIMEHVSFILAKTDSYWSRDYGPWFIANNQKVQVVDFPYNRPRPNDDAIPTKFADFWGADVYGMNLISTGGNYMTDGMGIAASCDLVLAENPTISKRQVEDLAKEYLGIEKYHFLDDPLDDYIEHIDCWGKFLDVDKILISKVSTTDYRYADYEAIADYWANQTSSYGNNYLVYRVYSPNGQPYTNSFILNNKVLVPIVTGFGNQWNDDALAVYEDAMPGYEVIGFIQDNNAPWESTDAIHCRVHEIPEKNMLHIQHVALFDTFPESTKKIMVSANVSSYAAINISKVGVSISINQHKSWEKEMVAVPSESELGILYQTEIDGLSPGDSVSYFIQATDDSGKKAIHPFMGSTDPHRFFIHQDTIHQDTNSLQLAALQQKVKLFPNPANDRLTLVLNNMIPGSVNIAIFNVQGIRVKQLQFTSTQEWFWTEVSVSDLSSGVYFVFIKSGDITIKNRFVVTH